MSAPFVRQKVRVTACAEADKKRTDAVQPRSEADFNKLLQTQVLTQRVLYVAMLCFWKLNIIPAEHMKFNRQMHFVPGGWSNSGVFCQYLLFSHFSKYYHHSDPYNFVTHVLGEIVSVWQEWTCCSALDVKVLHDENFQQWHCSRHLFHFSQTPALAPQGVCCRQIIFCLAIVRHKRYGSSF